MEEYQLYIENSLGNLCVGTFKKAKDLIKYVTDNPLEQNHYFVVTVKSTHTRTSIQTFEKVHDNRIIILK